MAVNSDMRPLKYKGDHLPEHYSEYQLWAREHDSDWVYAAFQAVLPLYMGMMYRIHPYGLGNIPDEPAIFVPNHFSVMDHFAAAMFLRRRARFMAKSQLFDTPLAWMFKHGGVFPVARGHRDEEAFLTAQMLLERGQSIIMYVQGHRSRGQTIYGEAKPGVGKLVHMTGAPVVPVAIEGTQYIRYWRQGWLFPKVVVRYGEPIPGQKILGATREQNQAHSELVFKRIKELDHGLGGIMRTHWYHRFRP